MDDKLRQMEDEMNRYSTQNYYCTKLVPNYCSKAYKYSNLYELISIFSSTLRIFFSPKRT